MTGEHEGYPIGYGSFMALVVSASVKFASVLPTGIAEASGQWTSARSSSVLPAFVAQGGQLSKGHIKFNRAQQQYLDAGRHAFNIASNGGFTAVAVVRFTAATAQWERVFDVGNGQSNNNLMLAREDNTLHFRIYSDKGSGDKQCLVQSRADMVTVGQWMVIIARHQVQAQSAELRVDDEVFSATCSGVVTDRVLSKAYVGKSQWLDDGNSYLDAEVAGLFAVDRYLEVNAAKAMATAIDQGTDFTAKAGKNTVCSACPAGKFKNKVGSAACTSCPSNSQSTAGSSLCTCVAGYAGPEGGPCTECKPNTYKAGGGNASVERCGPKFFGNRCGGSGATALPSWALYCNEESGWCGQTDAHQQAQVSTAYDFVANNGGPPCEACPSNTSTASVGRRSVCDCMRPSGWAPSHSVILSVSLSMASSAFSDKVSAAFVIDS